MPLSKEIYNSYVKILEDELIPALGCTEPIAIAYAAAKAREVLGDMPAKIVVACSGNIIKNVKSVIVPTTRDLRGIEAAAAIGVAGGDPSRGLEVLASVSPEDLSLAKTLLKSEFCRVELLDTPAKLHIILRAYNGDESAMVEIMHIHTGIVRIERNNVVLLDVPHNASEEQSAQTDRSCLNVEMIIEFANTVRIADIESLVAKQVAYNTAISQEGLDKIYGANIGSTLRNTYGDDIKTRAKAAAAAGSDARMGGCELPVVTNSGSGNQGLTVSLPVIEYAKELSVSTETLYRALCLSNLIAIYQKSKIGRLSAYCGAVSASAGAGAGITYLHGGSAKKIAQTITNTLANVSGIICDGAKPSCAAKIASSVDAALMAFYMTVLDKGFCAGDGIVKDEIEDTIESVSRLAKDGMQETDKEILKIMIDK